MLKTDVYFSSPLTEYVGKTYICGRFPYSVRVMLMGRRGGNAFKHNDGVRAIRVARDGGIDPAMLEIEVGPNGSTFFRVFSDRVTPPAADPIIRSAREWDAEIEALKKNKGTMSRLRLRYVQAFTSAGGVYHYFRRRGSPRIPLPGLPGSHEFMTAYADALNAAPLAIGKTLRSRPGSISSAIAMYYGSQAFRSLQGGTPALRRAILEKFRDQYGNRTLATLPREFIAALLDAMPANVARNWLVSFRHFIRWAEARKLIGRDPTWASASRCRNRTVITLGPMSRLPPSKRTIRSAPNRVSRSPLACIPGSGAAISSRSVGSIFAATP
jgi:hypothetical protein